MEKSFSIPISRRDFMKLAGITALSAGLIGNDQAQAQAAENISEQSIKYAGKKIPVIYSVDVCVCGGGPSALPQLLIQLKMEQILF